MELTKVVTIARSRGIENVSLFVVIWILAQLEMHETGLFPSSMERTTGDYWDGEAVIAPLSDEETTGTLGSGYLLDNASAVQCDTLFLVIQGRLLLSESERRDLSGSS